MKTKTFWFRNHLQSKICFETKVKLILKRKRFHL